MNEQLLNDLLHLLNNSSSPLSDFLRRTREGILDALELISLEEKLDAKLPDYGSSSTYMSITNEIRLIKFYEGSGREICWSDTGKQPKAGWYLVLSFSTGPYLFNSDYPEKSFNSFFEELKSFGAAYSDTHNHYLYFSLDENPEPAREVYKAYPAIYKKWWDEAQKEVLAQRIAKAKEELEKLMEKQK